MDNISVNVETKVNPTEDVKKVERAVKNFFPMITTKLISIDTGSLMVAKGTGKEILTEFYDSLRRERILHAARRILFKGLYEDSFTFYLNKQAAFVERISFCEPISESLLGPIKVQIICDDPKKVIDWLTP